MPPIRVQYSVTYSPDFTQWAKKTIAKAQTAANLTVGKTWHKTMLPEHFKPGAERIYHYAQRNPDYQKRKAILNHGVVRPLVGLPRRGHVPGELMRAVTRVATLSASTKKLTLKMSAPPYVTFRGPTGTGPDMVSEILAVSAREGWKLADQYGRVVKRELEDEPKKKRYQN